LEFYPLPAKNISTSNIFRWFPDFLRDKKDFYNKYKSIRIKKIGENI
jgi:hypothetical protein